MKRLSALVSLLLLLPGASPVHAGAPVGSARTRLARAVFPKPAATIVAPRDDPRLVVVKFVEGTRARLSGRGLEGRPPFDAAALDLVLSKHGVDPASLVRVFGRPSEELEAERALAQERSGRELADLNLYYRISVPPGVDPAGLCDALNRLGFVELAKPASLPAPVASDLPPTTPDLSFGQGYLAAAPQGVGALDPALVPGADGAGISLVDVEMGWIFDHEDLEVSASAIIDPATPVLLEGDHGLAVLGIIGALPNRYGVDGIAPAAALRLAPRETQEFGISVPRAISLATAALLPGDVILLEMGVSGCSDSNPLEWDQATFDAISIATALGIVVIEPAGNGGGNLDAAACMHRFDRSLRDSGAIMVGAGDAAHRRLAFSSYGSRLDVQAWGQFVTTSGYGDAFDPGDEKQRYTATFNGTSSASAIMASVALAVQGARKAERLPLLEPAALRQLFVATGSPQSACDPPGEKIGAAPSIPASLSVSACSDGLDNDGDELVDDGDDPGCDGADDGDELDVPLRCSDGVDNDGDGFTDQADADCAGPGDPSELRLRAGDLLVADVHGLRDRSATGGVLRVDPATGFQTPIVAGAPLLDPTGLALGGDGALLVTDFTSGTLVSIDPSSSAQTVLAECLGAPWGVAVANDGAVFVTVTDRGQVVEVDPTSGDWSPVSSGQNLVEPRGIAVEGPEHLIVADSCHTLVSDICTSAVVRVTRSSGAQAIVSAGGLFQSLRGVTIDAEGDILVADPGARAIFRVSPQTGAQTIVSSGGHLVGPRNLALDFAGRVLVAEQDDLDGSGSILRIDPTLPDDGLGGNQTVVSAGGAFVDPIGLAIVVPEPSRALLAAMGAAALWLPGRRSRETVA